MHVLRAIGKLHDASAVHVIVQPLSLVPEYWQLRRRQDEETRGGDVHVAADMSEEAEPLHHEGNSDCGILVSVVHDRVTWRTRLTLPSSCPATSSNSPSAKIV